MIDKTKTDAHWSRTSKLLKIVLALWFFFAYLLQFFIGVLNEISFLGFPLGYYMSAQGSLLAFVIIIFWYAKKQNQIDEEFGLAEDEQ